MDLHVVDPSGFEIYFSASESTTGGRLDVDDIPNSGDGGPHVENVFWPAGGAPPGQYQAFVVNYASPSGSASSFTLQVKVGDQVVHTETGTLAPDQASTPFEFTVGPSS